MLTPSQAYHQGYVDYHNGVHYEPLPDINNPRDWLQGWLDAMSGEKMNIEKELDGDESWHEWYEEL